jgi:hypothetical protein
MEIWDYRKEVLAIWGFCLFTKTGEYPERKGNFLKRVVLASVYRVIITSKARYMPGIRVYVLIVESVPQ